MIRKLYRFVNRNWWQINAAALLIILALILVIMAGCGTERDTQTKAVEKLTTVTGPVVIDTPIGQFVAQPIRHEMVRSEEAVETQQTRMAMPELAQIMQAAPGVMSMGPLGIAGTALGLITTAATGWAAMRRKTTTDDARRRAGELEQQRDELIDGAERMKGKLSNIEDPENPKLTAWDHAKVALEAEQSKGTKAAVKARTA